MPTDYNRVSKIYDIRYKEGSKLLGVLEKLLSVTDKELPQKIIEIGCGTGYWLSLISKINKIYGLDLSLGMLNKAKLNGNNKLICANANKLPLKKERFDVIFIINALHHFNNPKEFILNSFNLLATGGKFLIFATTTPNDGKNWYIYKYFNGVLEKDNKRFLEIDKLKDYLTLAGYKNVKAELVDKVINKKIGTEILSDPFLIKDATSQLADITIEEYEKGIDLIKEDISQNKEIEFKTELEFYVIYGEK